MHKLHPDVVAIWAKSNGQGCLCTLDTCLVVFMLSQAFSPVLTIYNMFTCNNLTLYSFKYIYSQAIDFKSHFCLYMGMFV